MALFVRTLVPGPSPFVAFGPSRNKTLAALVLALGASTVGAEVVEPIDPFLATPAANHLWQVPVVVISYLPTVDSVKLDPVVTGSSETLASVRARIAAMNIQRKGGTVPPFLTCYLANGSAEEER